MRVTLIGILLLLCSCVHEKVPEPVVSRPPPPPFWPPHEYSAPPQQGPMITLEAAILLRRLVDSRTTNEIVDKDE